MCHTHTCVHITNWCLCATERMFGKMRHRYEYSVYFSQSDRISYILSCDHHKIWNVKSKAISNPSVVYQNWSDSAIRWWYANHKIKFHINFIEHWKWMRCRQNKVGISMCMSTYLYLFLPNLSRLLRIDSSWVLHELMCNEIIGRRRVSLCLCVCRIKDCMCNKRDR